jgi:glyoxylase-like metal-dependent hydrolase (beta-lactamase superfamily II)
MSSFLQVDVYCAPIIPAVTGSKEPNKQLWSPICCTLIQGPTSAVLVDTPTTIELSKGLLEWVKKTAPGKKLMYIYTTHAHGDHFFGNPIILAEFPEAKSVATSFVIDGIRDALTEKNLAHWEKMFPDQLPDGQVIPDALPTNGEFFIDGHSLYGINVAFSDTQNSSFLHVPSLGLVVSGDIVYGECFQHLGEANTAQKRKHWLDALDQIAALKPSLVVPGHKRTSQLDGPYLIDLTREYIIAFEEEINRWKDADKVEAAMKKRYPHRWNDFILGQSCSSSVAQL